jgi:Zn-dependent protease with chaperone function
MMMPLASFVWCIIQVSLIAALALMICWSMRGTRPQFTTALLSGCALGSLLLGVLAWFPSIHWSIGDPTVLSWMGPTNPTKAHPTDSSLATTLNSDSNVSFSDTIAISDSRMQLDADILPDERTEASPSPALFVRWFLDKVQSIDAGVREAERSPVVLRSRWGWTSHVAWALAAGIGLMSGLWIHAWLWMRWMVRNSESLSCQTLEVKLRRISEQMKLGGEPVLRVSDRIPIGATVGVRYPVILINRQWQQWTDQELEAVLLHEVAHIARRDFLWAVVGSWVRVLFFFHPLMHLLMLRWRMEQELAADQLAAGWMKDARAYGRALASLALRADGSFRTPSPMLSAEQICVIRRITMLKQGRLMPRRHGWRWGYAMTAATLAVCLPLTGLRGTPPEEEFQEKKSAAESKSQLTNSKNATNEAGEGDTSAADENLERLGERIQRLKEVREKCPPLQFDGFMIWNPSKLLSNDFDPGIRYFHNALTFALLGSFPKEGSIHGRTHVVSGWSDTEKEHGNLQVGAQISEADQVNPNVLSRLLTHPSMGGLRQSKQVKTIEGRQARGVTQLVFDTETSSWKESDTLAGWMVDDEQGFLHGSEEEIEARLQGKTNPYASIPADFLDQYQSAAFATVFADCTTWQKGVEEHFRGSKEQKSVALAYPLFNGLQHLGLFIIGSEDFDCVVRAAYSTAERASESKAVIDGLVFLAQTAVMASPQKEDVKTLKELLGSLRIDQFDREIRIRFNPPVSLYQSEALLGQLRCPIPGWYTLLGTADSSEREPNTIRFQGSNVGCIPAFLTQSISAEQLRRKRVRLNAELSCNPTDVARTGLVLWASKQDGQSIVEASMAADGASSIESIANHASYNSNGLEEKQTYSVSIELDVPDDCDVLSLGIYAKQTEVSVGKVRLEVNPPALVSRPVAIPITPRSLLQVPFVPIHSAPRNLDFSEPLESSTTKVLGIAVEKSDSLRR